MFATIIAFLQNVAFILTALFDPSRHGTEKNGISTVGKATIIVQASGSRWVWNGRLVSSLSSQSRS
jgi:hypothetical protein